MEDNLSAASAQTGGSKSAQPNEAYIWTCIAILLHRRGYAIGARGKVRALTALAVRGRALFWPARAHSALARRRDDGWPPGLDARRRAGASPRARPCWRLAARSGNGWPRRAASQRPPSLGPDCTAGRRRRSVALENRTARVIGRSCRRPRHLASRKRRKVDGRDPGPGPAS